MKFDYGESMMAYQQYQLLRNSLAALTMGAKIFAAHRHQSISEKLLLFKEAYPRYDISTTDSATSAILEIADQNPDIIIWDARLPDLPCRTFLQMIRAGRTTRGIPIMLISTPDDAVEELPEAVGDSLTHLADPFTVEELKDKIVQTLTSKYENLIDTELLTWRALEPLAAPWKVDIAQLRSENGELSELDRRTIAFLGDEGIPRIIRVHKLWQMILRAGFESESGQYLLDCLETLNPIELTQDLIFAFRKIRDVKSRIQLLNIIKNCAFVDDGEGGFVTEVPFSFDVDILKNIEERSKQISGLFEDVISRERDRAIVREACLLYPFVSSYQQALELYFRVSQEATVGLSDCDLVDIVCTIALSTEEGAANLLPTLLSSITKVQPELKLIFNRTLTGFLTTSTDVPLGNEVMNELRLYLDQQLALSPEGDPFTFVSLLEARSSLEGESEMLKDRYILSRILSMQDSNMKAAVIALSESTRFLACADRATVEAVRAELMTLSKCTSIGAASLAQSAITDTALRRLNSYLDDTRER